MRHFTRLGSETRLLQPTSLDVRSETYGVGSSGMNVGSRRTAIQGRDFVWIARNSVNHVLGSRYRGYGT